MSAKEKDQSRYNRYDRLLRENAESLFIPLIRSQLNIDIESYQVLPHKISRTVERELDFLYQVTTDTQEHFLLHVEFQTRHDYQMLYRMAEYHGLVYAKYRLPIRHVVIYLGLSKTKMKTHLEENAVFRQFEFINLHDLDAQALLNTQVPEVILLAILADLEQTQVEPFLKLLLQKLKNLSQSPAALSKYLHHLTILSRLRNLESLTTKLIRSMPIYYDVESDGLYLEGLERGLAKGLAQAKEQAAADRKKAVLALVKMGITQEKIAEVLSISLEKVRSIIKPSTS